MISKGLMQHLTNIYNDQEGQSYPCSNPNVICGFVTDNEEKWKNFIQKNKNKIKIQTKNKIILENGECWTKVPINNNCRGNRFYKIKIDKDIDKNNLKNKILPYCVLYCCELEWI